MEQYLRRTLFLAAAATTSAYTMSKLQKPQTRQFAYALATDEDRKNMQKIHTNTYVWGEGYQVDASQEFSNFTPKKIRNFEGAETPDIVDMSFGWYHEAYIDKQGKLYVCAKAKMSSIKIAEIKDGVRNPLTEVKTLPKGTKVRQVSFTRQRMFVLSDDGKVYVYRIEEKAPERDLMQKTRPTYTGELLLE